ncbi:hypothetical protein [Rufibacter sp. LB8]|uniref:hypothetical protein n=1 Tax=Rufibacter sp. LB8 TaxID=2777781 RepID=UPI00178C3E2B|nr:hypothetical protein [Rufibacter sp. LB8]
MMFLLVVLAAIVFIWIYSYNTYGKPKNKPKKKTDNSDAWWSVDEKPHHRNIEPEDVVGDGADSD